MSDSDAGRKCADQRKAAGQGQIIDLERCAPEVGDGEGPLCCVGQIDRPEVDGGRAAVGDVGAALSDAGGAGATRGYRESVAGQFGAVELDADVPSADREPGGKVERPLA